MDAPWTLEELTSRVADATQRLGLLQANGQVADVPNARAIRWYQSTGLIRRPQQRGRVAYYGVAHLRELVAIKRLQSQGLTLDQVQQSLQGKSDEDVRVLAGVPADVERVADMLADSAPAAGAVVVNAPRSFWADDVAEAVFGGAVDVTGLPAPVDAAVTAPGDAARVALVDPSGVTVVLPPTTRAPTADDAQAILSAVVSQLVARGLLASSTDTDPARAQKEED